MIIALCAFFMGWFLGTVNGYLITKILIDAKSDANDT